MSLHTRRPLFLATTVYLCLTASAVSAQSTWSTGLDLAIETAQGLKRPSGEGSLGGLALAHFDWEQVRTADGGWHHRAHASLLTLAGKGPTERFLNDFHGVSNLEGHRSTRLYSTWLESERGPWSIRAGSLLADEEFATTATGGGFLNSAFGWPSFISANTRNTGPVFFVPALGLRLQHRASETVETRLAIYDGDAFDSLDGDPHRTRHGLHHRLGGAQGWFVMGEIAARLPDAQMVAKLGGWAHTADFDDLLLDDAGQPHAVSGSSPRRHSGNHGVYVTLERTLSGVPETPGGITAHLRAGASPQDRNFIAWAFDAGVSWTGLFAAREGDVTVLGLAHSQVSRRATDHAGTADPASPRLAAETVVETAHTFAWNERLSLQPSVQYLLNPGGDTARRRALVFLLRLNASY